MKTLDSFVTQWVSYVKKERAPVVLMDSKTLQAWVTSLAETLTQTAWVTIMSYNKLEAKQSTDLLSWEVTVKPETYSFRVANWFINASADGRVIHKGYGKTGSNYIGKIADGKVEFTKTANAVVQNIISEQSARLTREA